MPNLKFTAGVSARKSAASKPVAVEVEEVPDSWQPLTRDELPEDLRDMYDQVDVAHTVYEDAKRIFIEGLTESLKRGKELPAGKVVKLSWKKRFNAVSIGIVKATSDRKNKKPSGLKFS